MKQGHNVKVDAHQHFWSIKRDDYGWLTPELAALWRDFGPSDLAPLVEAAGVSKTIVVQAAPTIDETRYLLALTANEPLVGGIVGWVPMLDHDVPALIDELGRAPKFKAVRPMMQDLPNDDWIAQPELAPAVEALIRNNLGFDALVFTRHLPFLTEFAERYPNLRIVIDHAAKPRFPEGKPAVDVGDESATGLDWQEWTHWMAKLAKSNNVMCKLSGMVTEAAKSYTDQTFAGHVDFMLEAFGPRRLMWGSDWPVLNLNGDYASWFACAQRLTAALTEEQREAIFGGTAMSFYRL